ncbi:MAG TPA: carboxypeptidase-like regulatory domain-containing protein, partial [Vicinamibacterales bacterium]
MAVVGPVRLLICLLLLSLAPPAGAQEFRATVTGTVTDPAGLAMPGVTITVTNTQTNEVATAVTNEQGVYSLPFLRPGVYKVTAELEGFSKYEQDQVQLELGQARTINIQLQVGNLSEVVTVVSEAIEASKADRGMVIDNRRVTELPLNARNPFMLSYLSPGITYN